MTTPYPHLITEGVRLDLEGMISMVARTDEMLSHGIIPKDIGTVQDAPVTFAELNISNLMRHYPGIAKVRNIHDLFQDTAEKPSAVAFGNTIAVIIPNCPQAMLKEAFEHSSPSFDNWLKSRVLTPGILGKIFSSYLGRDVLTNSYSEEMLGYTIVLTTFACLILCNEVEFRSYQEAMEKLHLRKSNFTDDILIGSGPASNFIEEWSPGIVCNPIIIRTDNPSRDYQYYEAVGDLLNTINGLGEIYNLFNITEDVMELLVISESEIGTQLSNLGKIRVGPWHLRDLYGARTVNDLQTKFNRAVHSSMVHIQSFGTRSAALLYKSEGEPTFPALSDLRGLFEGHRPDRFIAPFVSPQLDAEKIRKAFYDSDGLLMGLRKDATEFRQRINTQLHDLMTTVQLNIAIGTLIWTIIITVLASRSTQDWITALNGFIGFLKWTISFFEKS